MVATILYPSLQQPPDTFLIDDSSNEARWHQQWSQPYLTTAKAFFIARMASGEVLDPFPRGTPEFIGPDKWWQPFGERLYSKPGLAAYLQQVSAYSESAQFPEVVYIDKYLYPFGEPKRYPPQLIAAANPYQFFVDFSSSATNESFFHQPFSEPVRYPRRLIAATQPAVFPNTNPIISIGWYAPLSEPKRFPKTLITSDQPFYSAEPEPEDQDFMAWFQRFSEPKRFPKRLDAALNPAFSTGAHALGTAYARGYVIC